MQADSFIDVSVIIPTKNRAALLRDALTALLAQTYPPAKFEVFVMDNQSTDDTEAIVREFAARAPFAMHYHKMERDGGPVPARNRAAGLARGRILAFTDSDCRPCPEWIARGAAAFTEGVGLVTGPVTYKPEQRGGFFAKRTAETLVEHPTYPTANAFYLKETFDRFGGFDVNLSYTDPFDRAVECADSDLAWRVIESGQRNVFVPDLWMYHEIEEQTLVSWLLEPTRLFILPELIRRHPQLRDRLLSYRVFFYRGSIPYYLAGLLAIPITILDWRWLLLAPLLVLARAVRRIEGFSPRAWVRAAGHVTMNIAKNYLLCLTLVYGSLRFRTLVL